MFVRPLVLLVYSVLYCFSVLVCCKSLHQNMATKEQIGLKVKKWKSLPSAFEHTWCVGTHLRLRAGTRLERRSSQPLKPALP
jgi:hypothetical protein